MMITRRSVRRETRVPQHGAFVKPGIRMGRSWTVPDEDVPVEIEVSGPLDRAVSHTKTAELSVVGADLPEDGTTKQDK
jgi:hypothetical protein